MPSSLYAICYNTFNIHIACMMYRFLNVGQPINIHGIIGIFCIHYTCYSAFTVHILRSSLVFQLEHLGKVRRGPDLNFSFGNCFYSSLLPRFNLIPLRCCSTETRQDETEWPAGGVVAPTCTGRVLKCAELPTANPARRTSSSKSCKYWCLFFPHFFSHQLLHHPIDL